MKKNYRHKKKVSPAVYPQMTIQDFELYTAVQLDDMIKADRCEPVIEHYGAKTFSSSGLRDEGYGVVVRCKDGSAFMINIKLLEKENSDGA